jgi:hypothetical protein
MWGNSRYLGNSWKTGNNPIFAADFGNKRWQNLVKLEKACQHKYFVLSSAQMGTPTVKNVTPKKHGDLLLNLRKLAEKIPASEMKKIPKDASTTYKQRLYGRTQ